jgi:signal transduction histidine kinase
VRPSKWSLGARITALSMPVVVLLTVLAIGAAVTASGNRRQLDDVFNKIGPLRADSQELESELLNQETGIQAYAVGGSAADLTPYNEGQARQQELVADMMAHGGSHQDVAADLAAVQSAMDSWRASVAQPVIAAVQAGNRATALKLIDPASPDLFDTVRTRIAALEATVVKIRDISVSDVQRSSQEVVWSLIGAVWLVVVAGLVLAMLLRRTVTAPVNRLAADVRQIASGDYNHALNTSGPPEIAALGADVDEMRRRIVADLRVVQTASDAVERANDDLERQAAELQRSNQDLEQFAYVASHDLQEPLRKVASFCQLLQRRYSGKLDERADQYISFAVDGAHRMQRLINDLLEFSRIGRITTGFGEVDLGNAVANAAASNDHALSNASGSVSYRGLPTVRGEEQLLTALFANVIGNSVKFARPGVAPHIDISATRDGDDWRVVCRDNGIGIDPDYADKVFVIFQRLHSRESYPGTGIGLAVAKRIVEYHGGHIWVDTSGPEGVAVCFTLPARVRDRDDAADDSVPRGRDDAVPRGRDDAVPRDRDDAVPRDRDAAAVDAVPVDAQLIKE